MKTAKWIALWSTIVIGFGVMAYAAPYRAYPGPALPQSQIAVLETCRTLLGVQEASITFVDGVAMPIHSGWGVAGPGKIELLPGRHQITFSLALGVNEQVSGNISPITIDINLNAGKKYKVKSGIDAVFNSNQGGVLSTAFSHWWVEITVNGTIITHVDQ